MPKKNFWTESTPRFKLIHFILGIIALSIIVPSSLYIYKSFFPRSFLPDINEITQLPLDIKKIEDIISSNSPEASLAAKMLTEDLPTISNVKIPSSFRIPTLLYHYVEYVKDRGDKIRISLNIEPYTFEQQLKTLKDAGYTFMTPQQIPDLFEGKITLPPKPIILTFDDGYRDFYTDVFPIIKKYNVKVVAYIVPGFLDKPNNLTHKQLKEIADSGLVEIAAHTVNHAYLKGLSEKRVKFEVEQSKSALEKELHIPIISFAYPYGAFDLHTIQAIKTAGFKTAVSTIPGVDVNKENIFFIYRLRPGARTGKNLLNFLETSSSAP